MDFWFCRSRTVPQVFYCYYYYFSFSTAAALQPLSSVSLVSWLSVTRLCLPNNGCRHKSGDPNSPWRDRPIAENLKEFENMRMGLYPKGEWLPFCFQAKAQQALTVV